MLINCVDVFMSGWAEKIVCYKGNKIILFAALQMNNGVLIICCNGVSEVTMKHFKVSKMLIGTLSSIIVKVNLYTRKKLLEPL